MTAAGLKSPPSPPSHRRARPTGRPRSRSRQPVLVARVTLSPFVSPEPLPAVEPEAPAQPQSRRNLHVARRLRRRDALCGLAILAAAFGGTVAVLDVLH
jgi:hypothetical protein